MLLETDRLTADWLNNVTVPGDGVNALLASTPVDSGDSVPANLATITDETRDENVARGQLPDVLPALAVSIDAIEDLDGQVVQVTRDGKVKVRIRVGVSNAVTSDAVRDVSYYLRTAMRSLRKMFDQSSNALNRTRNGIYLETCDSMAEAIVWTKDQADTSIVTGYILATLQLRDLAP
jgi:hypothetical protein